MNKIFDPFNDLASIIFLILLFPLYGENITPNRTDPPAAVTVPLPKILPDPKGEAQQREQSASFLKWIDPQRTTKTEALQVHFPRFMDQVYILVDDQTFTHLPRAAVLWIPSEGRAKSFFKSEKESRTKIYREPEKFILAHSNLFEKYPSVEGKAPPLSEISKDKIAVLYDYGKITIPQK